MNPRTPYTYIFDMLDYAELIINLFRQEDFGGYDKDFDAKHFFVTLMYIEDILNNGGRSMVASSARKAGSSSEDSHQLLVQATTRMDVIRKEIRDIRQKYDFDETIRWRIKTTARDYLGEEVNFTPFTK